MKEFELDDIRNIGMAFDVADSDKIVAILSQAGVDGGNGEGNRTVGYEITVPTDQAEEAITALKNSREFTSGTLMVWLFHHPHPVNTSMNPDMHKDWLEWRGRCMAQIEETEDHGNDRNTH